MASAQVITAAPTMSDPHTTATIYLPTPSLSAIRRKPLITYQSPSSTYNPPSLRIEAPALSFTRAIAAKAGPTSSSSSSSSQTSSILKSRKSRKVEDGRIEKPAVQRMRYSMGPPLPLYHPLGRLALSLPELDPATLGLPQMLVDDGSRRASARTRRPAAKLRDADDDATAAAVAVLAGAVEVKDKASPKKKGGARPGAGIKRKRKDADEDATYPAKKTRNPRGGPMAGPGQPESPSPPVPVVELPIIEAIVDAPEDKKPERRSTRARGSLLRRDSSASEATATSVSISVAVNAVSTRKVRSDDAMEIETPSPGEGLSESGAEVKSEGSRSRRQSPRQAAINN